MYTPNYGYSPGGGGHPPPPQQRLQQQQQQFQQNGAPPQNQQPPQQQPHHQNPSLQQQQAGQQPQHMMFNASQPQYPIATMHQSPYGASGPSMGPNAGGMAMAQNNGMAHMAGPHVPTYQTPYSGSPYAASIPPTSSPSNMHPNFMPPTSNATSFPMNAPNMNMNPQQQQHQAQRMQPPPNVSTPTPGARGSPFGGMPNNTPPNASNPQSQYSTPQNPNQTHLQTPNNQQAQSQGGGHGGTALTPQTPNFPPGAQSAGNNLASPLSPGSQAREKERVSLLLDINTELLMEVMHLQVLQKKEGANTAPDASAMDKEKVQKMKMEITQEYVECMKRLQSNLAYLAAIADRSHKPSSQIPAHPAIMVAPSITPKPESSNSSGSPKTEEKKEEGEERKPDEGVAERIETLKDYYKQLQALFPGVDPNKEPSATQQNPAARTQQQQQALHAQAQQKQQQGQNPGQPQGSDLNQQQQKMQQELMKQKMMQQAQQQHLQNQHQIAQNMQQQGMNPQQHQNR